jgi:hypothetical protein
MRAGAVSALDLSGLVLARLRIRTRNPLGLSYRRASISGKSAPLASIRFAFSVAGFRPKGGRRGARGRRSAGAEPGGRGRRGQAASQER